MLYLTYVTVPLINCAMALHNIRKFASKMSDEFSQCCSRFKDAIIFTQPGLGYEAREKERRAPFTLEITYPLLRECHKIVQERNVLSRDISGQDLSSGGEEIKANSPSTSAAENLPTAKRFSYIDLVEKSTFWQCFAFSDDENIRGGTDEALLNYCL